MELSPELQSKLEQLAKLPKHVRLGLLVGLCAVLGVTYYFGVYQGLGEQLAQLRSRELELQRKLSEVRSVAANLGAFEEEIASLRAELKEALRQLPNDKELEVLLTDISNLGKKAGVAIESFKRNSEVVHDFYAEVPISLELEGRYHDIAQFFDLMARLPRIVNMGSLVMKVGKESTEETRISVKGTATTFRFVGSGKA